MGTEIYAVVRRDGSDVEPGGTATAANANAKTHRISAYPLDASNGPAGTVTIYATDTIESLRSAGTGAVQPSDDVILITEHCLTKLMADAITGLLGAPPSTVWRELPGAPPKFDRLPDQIDEPALPIPPSSPKKPAAGIIVVDQNGCLTIVEPLNHFGGYTHTYPKGHAHLDRETLQQAAHRELFEETGLQARILAIVGDFAGDTTITRYYLGVLIGGTATTGDETAHVKTAGPLQALALLNKQRDKDVLRRTLELAAAQAQWDWKLDGDTWQCHLQDGRIVRSDLESASTRGPEDQSWEPGRPGV